MFIITWASIHFKACVFVYFCEPFLHKGPPDPDKAATFLLLYDPLKSTLENLFHTF